MAGDGMFGLKLDRLDTDAREAARGVPGMSLRADDGDDVLFGAGLDARVRLATLELRCAGLFARRGEEGVQVAPGRCLGECMPGDCGAVFAAVWSERRFSECERRRASLFVDGRAGAPLLGGTPGGGGVFCICVCVSPCVAAARRVNVCAALYASVP